MSPFILVKDEKGSEVILNLNSIIRAQPISNRQVRGTSFQFIGMNDSDAMITYPDLSFEAVKSALGIQESKDK